MNKKLTVLAIGLTVLLMLGGIQTSFLYGTTFFNMKPGYTFSVAATSAWWDCNWSYAKKITIDHTKVQADQTDFPVLLHEESDADLATYAQDNGNDIVFVDRWNLTQYSHEIEKFNGDTGELWAWVNVTSLSSTQDTILYMYYGDPTCGNQENAAGTWDSGYAMVQHLSETSGTHYDSTSHNNDGTPVGGVTQNVIGKIDGAVSLDGTNAYINSGTSASVNITNQITLEGWVQDPPFFGKKQINSTKNVNKIEIIKAEHLDTNKIFVSNIYNETKSQDNHWSEPVYNGECVRVTFENALDTHNDITIFARSNNTSQIAVYAMNNGTLITSFKNVTSDKWYKILLTNVVGRYSTFDLITSGDYVEYDYIVDPTGWVSPTGFADPTSQWSTETKVYDDNTGTYATHTGAAGWRGFLELTLSSPIYCNRVRVFSDFGGAVDQVDVDIYNSTSWIDKYNGTIANDAWAELSFSAETNVTKARFRYHYTSNGWNFWLYEFDFWQGQPLTLPNGTTLNATSIDETTAILKGNVSDDGGEPCEYRFQYGSDTSYGNSTTWGGSEVRNSNFGTMIHNLILGHTYQYRVQVRNSVGTGNGSNKNFTTATPSLGWVTPTNHYDSNSQWENEINIYDDDTNTYARSYHDANDPDGQWSFYIYVNHSVLLCDKVRFYAKGFTGDAVQIDQADLDVNRGGVWVDVFQGSFSDRQWVEKSFTQGSVNQARMRFHVNVNNGGMYYELDEFDFNKSRSVPMIINEGPTNRSWGVSLRPQMNITVNSSYGNTMTISWYSNSSGSWQLFSTNSSVTNGTYHQRNNNFNTNNTKYWWKVIVTDGAGTNTSTYYFSTTDTTKPSSNVIAITPYWKKSSATITATASDAGWSGLKNVTLYYRFSTDNSSWGGWVNSGLVDTDPWVAVSWSFTFSNGSGYYQFYSIAKDNATNTELAPGSSDAKCGYETTAPSSSVSAITPYWKTSSPQTLSGTASDTGPSGLKNVTLRYRYRATNASSWGGWVNSGLVDTDPWVAVSWSFTFSNGSGHYQFYSIANDNATNTEAAPGSADTSCGYDNLAPTSSLANGRFRNSTLSTYEWNGAEGRHPSVIRLGTSEYYLIASEGDLGGAGATNDGWLFTIRVWSNNGTIRQSLVDSWEYDNSDGYYPSICLVNGSSNIYAITYEDATSLTRKIITTRVWSNNGSMQKTILDTLSLYRSTTTSYSKILNVNGYIYAVAYVNNSDGDGRLATCYITSGGDIGNSRNDTLEFNSSDALNPQMCLVDSDTIAIVYDGGTAGGNDGYLVTYNISSTGDITNTWADQWEFDTSRGTTPNIFKVWDDSESGGVNGFVIGYEDTNSDLYVKTCTISDAGLITKSWTDTQAIDTTNGDYCSFALLGYNSSTTTKLMLIGFSGESADGYVSSFDVTNAGLINTEIDSLEFDSADCISRPWLVETNASSVWLVVYESTGNDGWSCTVTITTNGVPYWKTTSPFTVIGTGSDNGLSGLKNVTLWYRYRATSVSSWGSWTRWNNAGNPDADPWVAISWSFDFPNGTGHYQFYSIAADNLSNTESAPGSADFSCGYDNQAPTSSVNAILPYWKTSSPTTITTTASDTGSSGLKNVTLYYRYRATNASSWGSNVSFGVDTDPWVACSWSFTFPNGAGHYQFYSIAVDNATNTEPFQGNDTSCGYTNLILLNCSTDKNSYNASETVTFTAWVYASIEDKVTLLLTSNTSNLESCNYNNRGSCIANSSNTTINSQPQQLTATMIASSNQTWYAKVCSEVGICSYVFENITSWNKTYDARGDADYARSVTTDTNNNVYVVGMGTNLNSTSSNLDWWIMKFDSAGIRLWNKTYDARGSADYAYSVTTDTNNNVYVAGFGTNLNSTSSSWDWWIMKFDSAGTRLWNKTYDAKGGIDCAYSVTTDTNNNVYVAGFGNNLNSTSSDYDWWIKKFDSNGNEDISSWNKTYDGKDSYDYPFSVTTDTNNNVYVAGFGTNLNSTSSSWDWWIMKFDSAGTRLWNKTYDAKGGIDCAYSVTTDTNNNAYIVGYGTNLISTSSGYDWWIMKFDSAGTRLWNKTYDARGDADYARSVTTDTNNNVYIVGYGTNLISTSSGYDWWIMKFDSAGTRLWNKTYDAKGSYDSALSVTTDTNNNVYVAGFGTNLNSTDSDADWWIKKFEYITGNFTVIASTLNSSVSAISPYWKTTSPQTINGTAIGSGLKNVTLWYRYRATNASSWGGWINSGLVDTDPWVAVSWNFTFPNGTGHYQFYSIARDNASNAESAPAISDTGCGYDNQAPSSSVDTISGYWKSSSPLVITATANDTGPSGLKNVTLYYRYRATNASSWGSNVSFGVDTDPWVACSWSFTFPNGTGHYQFYSIAKDNASNAESAPAISDTGCGYDNQAPSSSVDTISGYWKSSSPLVITATANDTGPSGLKNVTLYYYNSSDNSTWNGPWNFGADSDPWVSCSWNFNFPNGTGWYRLYSRAADNNSNIEDSPITNDTECGYDIQKPSSSVDTISPYTVTSSPLTITATANDIYSGNTISGVKNVTLWYRYSNDNVSWWNASWMYRKRLTINQTKVAGTLSNFPILVYFSSESDLASDAQDDGDDIVFTTSTGTKLNHEIEYFNGSTGALSAWVNVTSLSSTTGTIIWMYYGNSACSSQQNGHGTWDSNFKAVYHLSEISGGSGAIKDSTSNHINGTNSGGVTFGQTGQISKALKFNGTSGKVNLSDPSSFDSTSITAECWMMTTASHSSGDGRLVTVGSVATNKWALTVTLTDNHAAMSNRTASHAAAWTNSVVNNGVWHYLAGIRNPEQIYMDGSLQSSTKTDSWSFEAGSKMGSRGTLLWYNGYLDEVRISSVTRNASWVNTTYNTIKSPSTFFTKGGEESWSWNKWNNASNPDTSSPWSWNFNFPNGRGYYQFYSIANDTAGNKEDAPSTADAICRYINDTTKPTSTVNAISSYWKKTSPLTITATASDTGGSGLKNVTLYYYNSSNNNTWYGPWNFGTDNDPWVSVSWSFTFPKGVGYYRFYSRAADNDSNIEDPPVTNDTKCGYDNQAPSSSVSVISPYWKTSSPQTISGTASDTGSSGLKSVTLWYRYRATNASTWGSWTSFGTDNDPWVAVSWSFTFPSGVGHYQFYGIAVDNATNTESAPGTADASCGYDNQAPVSSLVDGSISDSTVSTFEWNGAEGRHPEVIRLGTSNYYLIAAEGDLGGGGSTYDGWLFTIRVWSNNGTIQLINSWEYDSSDGYYPSICLVNGSSNIYAITYEDAGSTARKIITTRVWSNNGSLQKTILDTLSLYRSTTSSYSKILNVNGNIYAVAYVNNSDGDGRLATCYITSSGDIGNSVNDTLEFNSSDALNPQMCLVDSNTIAIVYDGGTAGGNDGYLVTFNISSTGDITNTWADQWEFDTSRGTTPNIFKVWDDSESGGVNRFVIGYEDTNSDLYVKTCTISDAGLITKSWTDTQAIDTTNGDYCSFALLGYNGSATTKLMLVGFSGEGSDGYVSSFDVTNDGVINSEIDTLEFNNTDCISRPYLVETNATSVWLVVYESTGNDGWSCTVTITTNGVPYWKTTSPFTVIGTGSDNGLSGLKNVTLWYRYRATSVSSWGSWTRWNNAGNPDADPWVAISWSFDFPNGTGHYQFYSIAADNLSFTESAPGSADFSCGYDNQAPSSSVNAISPYINTTGTVGLTATASDVPSGVKNVTLWYRYSADNSSWDSWTQNITDTDYNWNWTFTFPNGTGYYEFYSIAYDNATNQESAPGAADARCRYNPFAVTVPIVTTNTSTGVEETNATMWGYLNSDGNETTTCGFWWDTTSGGTTNNQSVGVVFEGDAFSYNVSGLTPGQLYYFKAWANNSIGFNGTANEKTFLTKPNAPTSLTAQTNSSTKIYLAWTKGTGANTTRIQRKIGGYPTSINDGTNIYNFSGTQTEDTGLTPGITYYYRAWSYSTWNSLKQWSDSYASANTTTKHVPILSNENPVNGSTGIILNTTLSIQVNHSDGYQMNITWYWGINSSCPNYIGSNTTVTNGTYIISNDGNFSLNSQIYFWRITVNDGLGEWTNATYQFSTIPPNKQIVSKGRNAYALEISPAGTILYGYINGNSVQTSIDTNWHYISLTYDGSHIKLYKDGKLENTSSLSGSINTNAYNLLLGQYLSGKLDEVRVSSTARSAAWINTTYLNTNSPMTFATFGSSVGVLSTWEYRKEITINHSFVTATLTDFPILVFNASDTNLKNNAQSTGNDILFTSSTVDWTTGTWRNKLDYEIEKFDSTTGELEAWVRIPTLSSSTDTVIYMYYGNTLCNSNRQNPLGVWDSNYCGVWHLRETGSGASSEYADSTSKNNDGRGGGGNASRIPTYASSGKIDGANDFDGVDDYIDASGSSSLNITGSLTLETWINPDVVTSNRRVLQFSSNTTPPTKGYLMEIQAGQLHSLLGLNGGGTSEVLTGTIPAITWTYVVTTWNTSVLTGYINGRYSDNSSPTSGDIDNPNSVFRIGSGTLNTSYFNGILDEVRISNTTRSPAWVNTTFNTINKTNVFLQFGKQMVKNVAPAQGNPSPGNGAIGQSLNPPLRIIVNDTNLDALNITFRTNASGSWSTIGTNTSVTNGSYQQIPSTMIYPGVLYYWSVNLTDGLIWTNATYHFTTMPEVPFGATASDGWIQNTSNVYATVHDATKGTITASSIDFYVGQSYPLDYLIYRGFIFFDTSAIPDGATITRATLSLYGEVDNSSQDFFLIIQNGQPTSPHNPLQSNDYYHANYSGNGGSFDTTSFSSTGYNNITLNSTGRGWVNKTGTTKICLRSSRDINNLAPAMDEYVRIYASEYWSRYKPKLIVVYSQ